MDLLEQIAGELSLTINQVSAVAQLLDDGATVPFIARYRKEAHDSLDEVAILTIRDRLHQLRELAERRQSIINSLIDRELLTPELEAQLQAAPTMAELEDLYLPYRPKKRTRAMIAREKGLEPLALLIYAQKPCLSPQVEAQAFIDADKGVENQEQALAGARDIIAEMINEDAGIRQVMRNLFLEKGVVVSKVAADKEEEGSKYRDYFDWSEPAVKAAGHRILAMRRGEKEGFLSLKFMPAVEDALALLSAQVIKNDSEAAREVGLALEDGYKRLLGPAMETELRLATKEQAEEEAIKVFSANLRQLLLAPPLGRKRVLALDPGYRTGCKLVCLDDVGRLLHHDVIYVMTDKQQREAAEKIKSLCQEFAVEALAVGNGTASRETEALLKSLGLNLPMVVVNESGASVYSASDVARREFPDLDLTVRGAVSIGRRLMDPLAELVKIDPKAIGVGQYQHDVDQGELRRSLDDVVISCVNAVGVEVNTASSELLAHVSGLGPSLAKNIVSFREQNGPFKNRSQLMDVPRLGPKAFEQAAGFLRVAQGDNPLDASAVHPESYALVEAMAHDLCCQVEDLLRDQDLRRRIKPDRYINDKVGLPTINDILTELEKPGRDPRNSFEAFSFADSVHNLEDLSPGQRLPGIVTNVTNFGAFVDIGVHQDGLVHISQLADKYINDPHQVVKVQDRVMVTVMEVDLMRRRISLSMRTNPLEAKSGKSEPAAASAPVVNRKKPPKPKTPDSPGPAMFNDAFSKALSNFKSQ